MNNNPIPKNFFNGMMAEVVLTLKELLKEIKERFPTQEERIAERLYSIHEDLSLEKAFRHAKDFIEYKNENKIQKTENKS